MNSPNEPRSFMDKNTIIAIVLTMVFFFGWSAYMRKKYPDANKPVATNQTTQTDTQQPVKEAAPNVQAPTETVPAGAGAGAQAKTGDLDKRYEEPEESFVQYNSEELSFSVTSRGMGLTEINIRKFQTRDGKPIILGQGEPASFATFLAETNEPVFFNVTKEGEGAFRGVAQVNGMTIEKTLKIEPSRYMVSSQVKVTNAPAGFKGLVHHLSDVLFDEPQTSLFGTTSDIQDLYYTHDGEEEHNTISKKSGAEISEKNVAVAALSSHYFSLAILNKSDLLPRLETNIKANADYANARLVHQPVNPSSEFNVAFDAYAGPKQLDILEGVDARLGDIIHFGVFAWIAKPLMKLLKWLNSFIHNWGWAIVVLTLIVRVIVMPFNIYSFKSMKVMQKLQPEMQRLREKYKNDPQTMNREVMDLMKRNKANPLGGCLPMLLQLPVFIALYSVLGQSVELYRAPWLGWITDLSVHDKFFVLPILMGITMYIQQKITPTTMDPAQAKVLQFMPIIFTVFMLFLPSGLTLYIFVSTLFGIIQQQIFMRDKTHSAKVSEAQA